MVHDLRAVPSRAAALLDNGAPTAALALLYRNFVRALAEVHGAQVEDGATEGDCAKLAAEVLDRDGQRYFAQLSGAWSATAYAQRAAEVHEVEALLSGWSTACLQPPARGA